ncbi:sigma-70 family RNA polymerase sigma factor [Isoptericola halotolerans]|uniref:sigma-70 family RNA polymerase sigma factor n=1 Tax=Isoptericola halotolerans TaxID=300560 RepID=UPI00388D3282
MRFGHRGPQDGEAADLHELGDDQLATAARTGTERAFGVLWDRHAGAGMAAARRMTAAFDPEDLVQEAYLRIWNALLNGRGPDGPFRPYLYKTLRNIAASWSHRPADLPVEHLPEQADPRDLSDDVVEGSVAMHAFRALPERWQSVLWYLEVEEMRPREAAPLLGLSASATAALAYRAREGLRRAWLQAHINVGAVAPACRWSVERMGDFLRDNLSRDVHHKVRRHVAQCDDCTALVGELDDVSTRLRAGLLPLFLGVPALAAEAGLGGTAAVGAAGGSPGAGAGGTGRRAGRLSTRQVQAVVGGFAVTAVVGAAAWAGSAVLGGAPVSEAPGAVPVASSAPPSSAGEETPEEPEEPSTTSEPTPSDAEDAQETDPTEGTTSPGPGGAAPGTAPAGADDAPDENLTTGADEPAPAPETSTVVPTPTPAPTPAVTSTATPTPSPTRTAPTPTPTPSPSPTPTPSPSPSPTPTEDPPDPPVLGTTTPAGTVTVFPRTSGQAPPGTVVTVTDEAGSPVNSLTVGEDGTWELTLDGLGTGYHGELTVTQAAPGQAPVEDPIGTYTFDLPQILEPADGAVVTGRLTFGRPGLTVDVEFDGTPELHVRALVDGKQTATRHTLGNVPLKRVVYDLEPGTHTFGLRVTEGPEANPRYGPTTTVTFTVVSPFGVAGAVPAYP